MNQELGQFNQGIGQCVNMFNGYPYGQNYGGYLGNVVPVSTSDGANGYSLGDLQNIQHLMVSAQERKKMSGNKPIVVCGGEQREAKDMDEAQQIAESLAHSKSADAYILKPVKKVAPKRDVVTTDLA